MKPTTTRRNAVIYARYSPRPGAPGETIAVQIERCRAYAVAHNLTLIGTHIDEGLSGATTEGREGLARAMELLKQNKGTTLIVLALSRLARNTSEALDLMQQIQNTGGDFASLAEQIDTGTPTGRFVFTLLAGVAQLEREQTAERTSMGLKHLKRRGRRVGRHASFGWKLDPAKKGAEQKDLLPNRDEQAALEMMLHLQGIGASDERIAEELNNHGFRARDGRKWYAVTVRRVLNNPAPDVQIKS